MRYVPFGAKSVSSEWATVLNAAVRDGVLEEGDLNSGHRTMAEQSFLFHHPPAGTPLVAEPKPTAPHIAVGHIAHALDIGIRVVNRFAVWLRQQGARPTFPVTGEPWHVQITDRELAAMAARLGDPLLGYTADERRWIREYDRLRRERRGLVRRRSLRRAMKKQRKRIWRAAENTPGGWDKANRRVRYASLKART